MPVVNKIFSQPPGALGPATLSQAGPIFLVEVSIPSVLEQQLRQSGQPVPLAERGNALIDTGATISAVDDAVIGRLNVSPIGLTNTGTAGGPRQQNLYPAKFTLTEVGWTFEFGRVSGANLTGLGIIALIGRDVLGHVVMTYNGPLGVVTLAI